MVAVHQVLPVFAPRDAIGNHAVAIRRALMGMGLTSEIFAGGLKDLKRARIFGTRTAAAALPSIIERLPNGDGFQFAIANYLSEGGKPLEGLGVIPDVEAPPTREALLQGKDPAQDAAVHWIESQRKHP